jgi:hypothetical protein
VYLCLSSDRRKKGKKDYTYKKLTKELFGIVKTQCCGAGIMFVFDISFCTHTYI